VRRSLMVLAVAALVLTACGSSKSGSSGSSGSGGSRKVTLVIKKDGCAGTTQTLAAGATTFDVKNEDADGITELEIKRDGHIVGEKENLTPGLSGSFGITLEEGEYEVECPGGASGTITVSAAATSDTTVAGYGAASPMAWPSAAP